MWRATGNANRAKIVGIFDSISFRKEAPEVVRELSKKYTLCLISGSMDLYVQSAAERLGVEHWYANTELFFDADDLLVDYDYTLDQAGKKFEQFSEFAKSFGLKKYECAMVGDGDGDQLQTQYTPHYLAKKIGTQISSLRELHDVLNED